jgi:hypothetical protein
MSDKPEKITLHVDASVFNRRLGDHIKKGEMLGQRGGQDVNAPFDALIKAASFEPDNHLLEVTLVRKDTSL